MLQWFWSLMLYNAANTPWTELGFLNVDHITYAPKIPHSSVSSDCTFASCNQCVPIQQTNRAVEYGDRFKTLLRKIAQATVKLAHSIYPHFFRPELHSTHLRIPVQDQKSLP